MEKRSHYHSMLNEKAKAAGFKPRKAFASSDIDQLCELVNEGKGVLIAVDLPSAKTQYPNIRMIPFSDRTISYSIAFIFRDYDKLDVAAKKFIEFVVDRS